MNRLCRKCDITGWESGNPHAECSNIVMEDIINLVQNNKEKSLKNMNQYKIQNAWFDDESGTVHMIISSTLSQLPQMGITFSTLKF